MTALETTNARHQAVLDANDLFRKSVTDISVLSECCDKGIFGKWEMADEICQKGPAFMSKCAGAVAASDVFEPTRRHGFVSVEGHRIVWRIELLDTSFCGETPDPANLEKTRRILSIRIAAK